MGLQKNFYGPFKIEQLYNRSLKYVLRAVSLSSFTRQFVCGIFLCVQSVICKDIFSENERGFKMILQPLNKITCTYTGKIN